MPRRVDAPEKIAPSGDAFATIEPNSLETRAAQGDPFATQPPLEWIWGESLKSSARPEETLRSTLRTSPSGTAKVSIRLRAVNDQSAGEANATSRNYDYELIGRLGQGGMGVVYTARQTAVDRTIALKMLKPEQSRDEKARAEFLAEAAVTSDLEHPNIVPIHDLGGNQDGALFYAMKRVQGEPWSRSIAAKSLTENLEVLLRVADAVAFAHARGVIHRDLKPDNVMLGGFGEVLVMDWGLAAATCGESKASVLSAGAAGTPAYMAPEMAAGSVEHIGTASDVYLLGAILYEIVAGCPPHTGKDVSSCLYAAAVNKITPTDRTGELVEIALRAMSTHPSDRYASVPDLQTSLRHYQDHSESLNLAARAEQHLAEAQESESYERYAQALFAYQEAHELWSGNAAARAGIEQSQLAYGAAAHHKGDFDLALSVLDADAPSHAALRAQITQAQAERIARQTRLRVVMIAAQALAALLLVTMTMAFFWVRAARDQALAAEAKAKSEFARAEQALALESQARQAERVQRLLAEAAEKNEKEITGLALKTLEGVLSIQEELKDIPAAGVVRRQLLDRTMQGLQGVAARLGESPRADRNRAIVHSELADMLMSLGGEGGTEQAYKQFLAAHEIFGKVAAADPDNSKSQHNLSRSYANLGDVSLRSGEVQSAKEFYKRALEITSKLAAAEPTDIDLQRQYAFAYVRLGRVSLKLGELQSSKEFYELALAINSKLAADDPGNVGSRQNLAGTYEEIGDVNLQLGELQAAKEFYELALAINSKLAADDPGNAVLQGNLSAVFESLGDLSLQLRELRDATSFYLHALEITSKLAAADPSNRTLKRDLSMLEVGLGDVRLQSGDVQAAKDDYERALATFSNLAASDPTDGQAKRDLAVANSRLGDVNLQLGEMQAARKFCEHAMEITRKLAAADPDNAVAQQNLAVAYGKLGDVSLQLGELQAAKDAYERRMLISARLADTDPTISRKLKLLDSWGAMLNVAAAVKDIAEARRICETMARIWDLPNLPTSVAEARRDNEQKRLPQLRSIEASFTNPSVVETISPEQLPDYHYYRGGGLAFLGRHAEGALEAAILAEWKEPSLEITYNAACVYALCLAAAVKETNGAAPDANAAKVHGEYRRQALEQLQKALDGGFFCDKGNEYLLERDPDLAALRDLSEFQAMVKQVADKRTPSSPAAAPAKREETKPVEPSSP